MAAAGHTCHEMHTHTHHANGSMSKAREGFLERAWGSPHAHALPAADAEDLKCETLRKRRFGLIRIRES
jgi:hypothetical protein